MADAVVVGAGAAGMMGARGAARRGAEVLVYERELEGPSNLRVSGGLFPGAGTRWQREAGIEDDPAAFAHDIRAKGTGTANEAIVDAVARRCGDAVDFLADVCGIPIHLVTQITTAGHGVQRLHATPGESGRELLALLRSAVSKQKRITLVEKDIRGIEAFGTIPVLLATGGFAGNKKLLREFLPEVADALHIGAGPNDGCAIDWGRARGAAVAGRGGYQGQGHVNPGGRTRLGMALPRLGAILVNREGKRFVDESIGPSELAAVVLAQPGGRAVEVFDRRIHEVAMKQGPYREAWEAAEVTMVNDLAELGLPSTPAEISKFERPLYAAWVTGALAHTQGGLAVDAHARVVRADGTPVEGLYAAGGAAAGLAGRGGEGYLPGNGLAQSFALGLIAGEEMART
ncbi:MAG: FAD-binding protein [Betaproteobacteria bacterium]